MRNKRIEIIIKLLSMTLLFSNNILCQTDWELAKDKDNILIYIRAVENSNIKEFKAITTVQTSMEKLEKLIEKVDSYTAWQANVSSAKVLKKINLNESYFYSTSKIPWPINDRDIIIYSKKTKDNEGVITYTYKCMPDYIEEKTDYLRIKNAKGKWQLIPKDNSQITIVYQFFGDPEGSIPNWIINMFLVDGPFETLTNLRKIVQ